MSGIEEYKCPCCGGAISFNSTIQKMKCPYCDTEFDIDTVKAFNEKNETQDDMAWDTDNGTEWTEEETEGLHSYICNSCGGEIIADCNTAATSCPFCGNPVVMTERVSGTLKPDFVIPFKLDKKAAKEGLAKHLNGKKLLPKVFKDQNHLDEVRGVYVPFWLFDTDADAQIRYRATKVRTWRDNDYRYTETKHYLVLRDGTVGFEHVPVDGSKKMPDDLMDSIEPFDFSEAVDFETAYLAGYLADKYDVTAENSVNRANKRVKKSTEDAFASTVHGYATVTPENSNIQLHNGTVKYALYPVWILNTTWNGENFTFAMNGQTGKFVGNLPIDKGAVVRWLLGITTISSAVVFGVVNLLHAFGIL